MSYSKFSLLICSLLAQPCVTHQFQCQFANPVDEFRNAIRTNDKDRVLLMLLLKQVSLDVTLNDSGYRPLHFAAYLNKPDIVLCLLDNGAFIDVRNDLRETPLIVAAAHGCLEAVQMLIRSQASLNLQDDDGETALHHSFDDAVACALLATEGIDTSLENKGGIPAYKRITTFEQD